MNSADTLFNVLGKLLLADLIEPVIVRESACLVEFTEELVDLKCGIIKNKFIPVGSLLDGADLFKITDDLLEIPRECENIGMLLLIECHIDTQLLVFLFQVDGSLLLLLKLDLSSKEFAGKGLALKRSSCGEKRHHAAVRADQSCLSAE